VETLRRPISRAHWTLGMNGATVTHAFGVATACVLVALLAACSASPKQDPPQATSAATAGASGSTPSSDSPATEPTEAEPTEAEPQYTGTIKWKDGAGYTLRVDYAIDGLNLDVDVANSAPGFATIVATSPISISWTLTNTTSGRNVNIQPSYGPFVRLGAVLPQGSPACAREIMASSDHCFIDLVEFPIGEYGLLEVGSHITKTAEMDFDPREIISVSEKGAKAAVRQLNNPKYVAVVDCSDAIGGVPFAFARRSIRFYSCWMVPTDQTPFTAGDVGGEAR